jgi:FixJ family two-component response regulator
MTAHLLMLPARTSNKPTTASEATLHFVGDNASCFQLERLERANWRWETYVSVETFLTRAPDNRIGCVIVDMSRHGIDEARLTARACRQIELPLIFVNGPFDIALAVNAVKAGAVEFFTAPVSEEALYIAIEEAIERSRVEERRGNARQALRQRHALLSERERQVMALIACGLLNKQAAFELGISEATVKAHRGQVMRKMEARSFAELVDMARSLDIRMTRGAITTPAWAMPAFSGAIA